MNTLVIKSLELICNISFFICIGVGALVGHQFGMVGMILGIIAAIIIGTLANGFIYLLLGIHDRLGQIIELLDKGDDN